MYLGFDPQTGHVYEGLGSAEFPAAITPIVTFAKLIESDADWNALPLGHTSTAHDWIFREDSFDPSSRIRRGRVYMPAPGASRPQAQRLVPHPAEDPHGRTLGAGGRASKALELYFVCEPLLSKPNRGVGMTLALGTHKAASRWRIVQTELIANGCVMVTLKALTGFGALPELASARIDVKLRTSVEKAVERVAEAAFKETPTSIIDQCRNAMTVVLSHWLVQEGNDDTILSKDLGQVATAVAAKAGDKSCLVSLAQVAARLHVRGKANEQQTKQLRVPTEEDAELAIQSLGFTLREIGWAKE